MSVSHSAGLQRGRVGRDTEVIARSGLPAELAAVVTRVVSACRLWKHERADVARELCAHFADGLDAGHSPQELASSFGDPNAAATLITRAKKRGRGPLWKFTRGLLMALLVLLGIYAILAVRYWAGSPTIAVDYVAKVNAPSLAVPEDQRAWPRYRDAYMRLSVPEASLAETHLTSMRGDADWERAAAYVRANAATLEQIRSAAKLTHSGYIAGFKPDFDPSQRPGAKAPPPAPVPVQLPNLQGSVYQIMLPHLAVYREMSRTLAFDARLAASDGDGQRAMANIRAIGGLARHSSEPAGVLIGQLVNISIHTMLVGLVDRLLADHPMLWSDAELVELSAMLNSWRVDPSEGRDAINMQMERASMLDVLQRAYSDDGSGDGRLVDLRFMATIAAVSETPDSALVKLGGPIASQFVASRAEMLREYDRVLSLASAQEKLPLINRDKEIRAVDRGLQGARYTLINLMMPSLARAQTNAALGAARRDAAVTGLALERYKRAKGSYPATLEALVPTYLAALPRDPWTGGAMQYRAPAADAVGGSTRPRLYVVGRNGTDDQGRGGASAAALPSADPDDQMLWGPAVDAVK
ncbi:MAG: type II secretion system protein GspG [Phycisphaerales bacterium]|jgi:hypothetical protein|nr:type II secretion system protein GspG [Phycisphaerales bacterium]